MTVRDALVKKRQERLGTVKSLVLCKQELFYEPSPSPCLPQDTVRPVTWETAVREAKWFGVDVQAV